jgi:hypothetical protein
VPTEHWAAVWKHYYRLGVDERDRRLTWDPEKNNYTSFQLADLRLVHPSWPPSPTYVDPYVPFTATK